MVNHHGGYATDVREMNIMARVFGWMALALGITATSAYGIAATPALLLFFVQNPIVVFLLFFVQIGLVLSLSAMIHRLSFPLALGLFALYSLSMGVTLSGIFMIYTMSSIVSTFIVAASMFAIMAVYGLITKSDLTSLGNLLFMALLGLVLAYLVNMFIQSTKFDIVLAGIGVVVFTLLVAVDAQRIKYLAQVLISDRESANKIALLGALTLYLDFVNLFLHLLRLLGKKEE